MPSGKLKRHHEGVVAGHVAFHVSDLLNLNGIGHNELDVCAAGTCLEVATYLDLMAQG